MGEALSLSLVEGGCVVCSGGPVCGFEVPATVGGLEEPAGVLAFTAGESIVAVSAMVCESWSWVTRTNLLPLASAVVLDTALTGLVAHGVLRRTAGGSSSIISAIV